MTTECHLRVQVGERHVQSASWPGPEGHLHFQEIAWPISELYRGWVPTLCNRCGALYDGGKVSRSAGSRRVWDTEDGQLHPGDMYFEDWRHGKNGDSAACWYWDNCTGSHLTVVLPNGDHWDVDSRASNCTLPEDRQHRCWVRAGAPPKVTAGKAGNTCQAGAGSIMSGDYHGFLRDGVLDP